MPRSAAATSDRAELGALPEWNLADLYPAPDSSALSRDLERADRDTQSFAAKWQGRLADLPGAELAAAVADYEALSDLLGRIGSYASLYYVGDTTDPARQKFYGDINQRLNELTTRLIFFELELNRIDDKRLAEALEKDYSQQCTCVELDVTQASSWKSAIETIVARQQRLDVLVNNAGRHADNLLATMPLADWQGVLAANLDKIGRAHV